MTQMYGPHTRKVFAYEHFYTQQIKYESILNLNHADR